MPSYLKVPSNKWGAPIGIAGTSMSPYNPGIPTTINPSGGGMPPIGPPMIGPAPGTSPIPGWLGDAAGWVGDVLDWAGIGWGGVADWAGGLIGSGGGNGGGTSSDKARSLQALDEQSGGKVKAAFIKFLQNAGMAVNFLNQFMNSPFPNWPSYLIDVALFWLQVGSPQVAGQPGFTDTQNFLGNQNIGPGTGGNLPVTTPGGGLSLYGGLLPMVMPATTVTTYARAPKGMVRVTDPGTGQELYVDKQIARRAGLYKPQPKPLLTGAQVKTLRKAKALNKRIKTFVNTNSLTDKCVSKTTRSRARSRK